MRSKILSCAGIVISALLIYWALKGIDFGLLYSAIKKGQFFFLLPALVCFGLSSFFRTLLWRQLLRDKSIRPKSLFMHLMLGLMANNILPARLGEFVRTFSAGREFHISRTTVFASIFLERLLDITWLLSFTSLALLFHFRSDWPRNLAFIAAGLLCMVFLFFLAVAVLREKIIYVIVRLTPLKLKQGVENNLRYYLETFFKAGNLLKSPAHLCTAVCFSFLSWAAWMVYLKFSLGIFNIHLKAVAYPLLTGIINLGVMIPSAPGYIGPFQFACIKGLGLFSIPKETALAFSIVFHASWYVPTTIIGLLAMWQFGFNVRQLKAAR